MAKIDFTKVEEKLAAAVRSMFIKKVKEGKPTVSRGMASYYAIDTGPRPKPIDPVIQALQELEEEGKRAAIAQPATQEESGESISESIASLQKSSVGPVQPPALEEISLHPTASPPTPLFLLRKHLLWFKRKKVKDSYGLVGTSEEEIKELRKKGTLTKEELQHIEQLLAKASDVKVKLIKKLGLEDDSTLVEKERKKHITKRFNIKETWLPLQ
ncbi:MAG: hypothetical protein JWO53_1054 [Chlamydiia bacterium]|nr:hypothetical protein [Chlamydiia bacterium]